MIENFGATIENLVIWPRIQTLADRDRRRCVISTPGAACKAAGSNIVISGREIRPGVRICMMEDPDGNWVELLQQG
ncbi:MAG: VOC family protein [Candidatus Azotimanducaceae bacterium]